MEQKDLHLSCFHDFQIIEALPIHIENVHAHIVEEDMYHEGADAVAVVRYVDNDVEDTLDNDIVEVCSKVDWESRSGQSLLSDITRRIKQLQKSNESIFTLVYVADRRVVIKPMQTNHTSQ